MRFNKEFLYHFSCENCKNWWSYASTDNLNFTGKRWFCPHCSHEHNPPHTDKKARSVASEEFMKVFRENM